MRGVVTGLDVGLFAVFFFIDCLAGRGFVVSASLGLLGVRHLPCRCGSVCFLIRDKSTVAFWSSNTATNISREAFHPAPVCARLHKHDKVGSCVRRKTISLL